MVQEGVDFSVPETNKRVEQERLTLVGVAAMQGDEVKQPRNHDFAGEVFTFREEDHELRDKYPEGVRFDEVGYPDFSPYAIESVEIDMKGNYTSDYTQANRAAGLDEKPEGYTWHHHQDCKTMQLVPTDLHSAVGHTGGASVIRNS